MRAPAGRCLTLRGWLLALVIAGCCGAAFVAPPAQAAGPQIKTSAPGYYRLMRGDFEITALNDGSVDLHSAQLLIDAVASRVRRLLARAYLKDPVETSLNAFPINTGAQLVLIDADAASLFGPTLGKPIANLKASGCQPEQVDGVYLTHMHPDPVGGLMKGEKLAFPRAIVRADQREPGLWLNASAMEFAPEDARGFFRGAMASMNPYVAAGRCKPFDRDTEPVPGIKAVAARGHTPGDSIDIVESQRQRLVIWGDQIHVTAVPVPDPGVAINFAADSKAAVPQLHGAAVVLVWLRP